MSGAWGQSPAAFSWAGCTMFTSIRQTTLFICLSKAALIVSAAGAPLLSTPITDYSTSPLLFHLVMRMMAMPHGFS